MRQPTNNESSQNNQDKSHNLPLGSSLWRNSFEPFSRTLGEIELGDDHTIANAHQKDRNEEHDNVDEEVVDALDLLDNDDLVGSWITNTFCWENFGARSLHDISC